ncbi:MAG TPA: outer membrane beta-barrel protein [Longimicrobium sp.]|nr:outer membrane beta-barrel protein [Longimicrobium sp.]
MIRASFAVLLALAAAAAPASAQLQSHGVKIGGTESTIETDLPSEDPEARRGFNWMIFAEWNAPGALALVTEAGLVERGYSRISWTLPVADGSADASVAPDVATPTEPPMRLDRRMQYVSVAALARVPVATVGPVAAYAIAGPRMNTLVGRRGDDSGDTSGEYGYRAVTWEATAGVGVEATRWLPLLVEARYNAGLNDAFSGSGWSDEAYHRAVDVMVGVKF